MLSQEHFIGYVTTTLNNTFANNFETNGAPYLGTHRTLYIFNLNITNLFIYLFIIIWARSQKSLRQKLVPIPLKVSGVAFALSLCCACYTICTSVAIATIDALCSTSLPRRRSSWIYFIRAKCELYTGNESSITPQWRVMIHCPFKCF